jgi:hypothetical protein
MPTRLGYAELRHIIPKHQEEAVWTFKDELQILSKDPLNLHKTAFVEYLRAKGEQLYAEATSDEEAQAADAYLAQITLAWKDEATRRYHARTA